MHRVKKAVKRSAHHALYIIVDIAARTLQLKCHGSRVRRRCQFIVNMWKFQIVAISLSLVWAYAKAQSSELVDKLQDMIEIREKARRFNVDRDFYFDFTNDYVPSIVRSGLSETTGDVTVVIRFATMLNLAR